LKLKRDLFSQIVDDADTAMVFARRFLVGVFFGNVSRAIKVIEISKIRKYTGKLL
jgi:hypothetical protein